MEALEGLQRAGPETQYHAAMVVTNFAWSSFFHFVQMHLHLVLKDERIDARFKDDRQGRAVKISDGYWQGDGQAILDATDHRLAGCVRPELATAKHRTERPGPDITLAELYAVFGALVLAAWQWATGDEERLDRVSDWLWAAYGVEAELQFVHPEWLPPGGLWEVLEPLLAQDDAHEEDGTA